MDKMKKLNTVYSFREAEILHSKPRCDIARNDIIITRLSDLECITGLATQDYSLSFH